MYILKEKIEHVSVTKLIPGNVYVRGQWTEMTATPWVFSD